MTQQITAATMNHRTSWSWKIQSSWTAKVRLGIRGLSKTWLACLTEAIKDHPTSRKVIANFMLCQKKKIQLHDLATNLKNRAAQSWSARSVNQIWTAQWRYWIEVKARASRPSSKSMVHTELQKKNRRQKPLVPKMDEVIDEPAHGKC